MSDQNHNDLWRDFPKTAQEFEARFATEEDCRAWWIKARWGDHPACARCKSTRVWTERKGFLFECADCGHQTSLTSGTLLEKTRKPFKVWFRAVFEISTQRTGISGKDLQRLLGFGSYKTAWTWLHKIRTAMVRPKREPLGPFVQMDEALVGGKGGPNKELVLVAVEVDGRVRLAHAENNDAETLKVLVSGQVAEDAHVVTDGHAGYNDKSLEKRPHEAVVQTKEERRENDAVQSCHWTISLLKRWLIGTHAGGVRAKYLQAYLDEFAFRYNRRKTKGVGRIAARVFEQLVTHGPRTMRQIIDDTRRCRCFPAARPELRA
jgi:Zn ribbon nucleic-acid-binding protein/transposase-like protein